MMKTSDRIGVVGGGLGGLAAACTLAARGYRVTLFERNRWWGGKAAVLESAGFRFDMGPTILTLPSVLRRVFAEAGQALETRLPMVKLEPQWRSFFSDGSTLDLESDVEAMVRRLGQFSTGGDLGTGYRRFLELSRRMNQISQKYFFYRPVGGMRDMFEWRASLKAGVLRDIASMRLGRTVAQTIRSHMPDARVSQMMDHFTQYVGSAPDASPAVLCGIAHMQSDEGVWYPLGGTGAVPAALSRLAGELGVELRAGTEIDSLVIDGGRVHGVRTTAGEQIELGAVVCNMDAVRAHRELMAAPSARGFETRRRYEPACSGVVLYLGLSRRYPHLSHHNFVFSADPHEEFEWIYRRGEPAPDPTAYLCAPAQTEPGVAPPGGEALYVLVHTPYLRPHHDWKRMWPAYRNVILKKLASGAGLADLESRIVCESVLTPQDIQDRYRVLSGAIYGLASHGRILGAFKPNNRSPDVRGLYLAGGAAHPGPGMPMVLMSGWIAADALDRDARAGRRGEMLGREAGSDTAVAGELAA